MPRRVGAASSPVGMTSSPSDMSIFSHNEEDVTELLADVAEETSENGSDNDLVATSNGGANSTDANAVVSANNADADSLSKELLDAFYLGTGNFLLAYNTRAGIGVLMRVFRLLSRRKIAQIFDLPTLLDEKQLSFRVEAVSMGLFLGWFTGGYRALKAVLPRAFKQLALRRRQSQKNKNTATLTATEQRVVDEASTLVAGAVAACAIGFVNAKRRRSLALYALTRALQCGYNTAKGKGYWHFWGSKWKYGDSLLFALSSAQIMYAFIMRPTTLPTDYFRFIQKTGPVEKEVLEIVRQANRGLTLDPAFVQQFIDKHKVVVDFPVPEGCPTSVSCRMIHHHEATCVGGTLYTFRKAFVSAFPLYLSLFIVPSVVIHFKKFLSRPFSTLGRAVFGATRSNSFLASFVALYMASICVQRRVMTTDHRFVYYVAGLLASVSILIEPKSRRSELALYVLPRAIDSLYIILNDRKIFTGVKNGEVLVFALSMACMMHSYEHEKDSMGPFLYSTLKRFLQSPTDKKKLFLAGLEQQQRAKREHNQQQQSTAVVPVDAPAHSS